MLRLHILDCSVDLNVIGVALLKFSPELGAGDTRGPRRSIHDGALLRPLPTAPTRGDQPAGSLKPTLICIK